MSATGPEEILCTWLRKAVTTTAEALDASETGVDVTDVTKFVAGDVFIVDTEQFLVTSIASSTLTVTRGYNSSTATTHTSGANIDLFRRRRFKLIRPINPQAVDRFPGKVTIGDYSKDSNDILSSWIVSDLTGGHGVADLKEGVDDNRYRFGNIYTRHTSQWTKPFLVTEGTLGSGSVFPLGDMYYSGSTYRMAASGSTLYQDTTSRGAMTGVPSDQGVYYRGTATNALYYIPQGSNGYSTFLPSGPTLTNNNGGGDPDVQSFLKWDEKLLALANDGTIYRATTAAATTTFTAYTLGGTNMRMDNTNDLKKMHAFYNRNGDVVPYVVTGGDVWAFDADTPRFYRIPDFESVHPYFGIASAVWRGELFVASGMDILAFNGEVVRNIGFARDDGLPYNYSFYVRWLYAGQNALYALVRGVASGGNTYHSVHEWTGFGWHCVFTTLNASIPVRMAVTAAGENYKLFWGTGASGTYYEQTLPTAFTNPREAIDNSGATFGITWLTPANNTFYLETGKFDANMKGYRKIANAVEMDVRTLPANNSVVLKYRIDEDTAWTTMFHTDGGAPSGTTVTTTGHHIFEFGPYDIDGKYTGIDFESIEFRLEYVDTATNTTTPAVTSIVFSFLKIMNPSLAWTTQLDLRDDYHDADPLTMLNELTELRTLPRFFNLKHRDTTYRVRMSGMQGSEEGGNDVRSTYQISWIEVPTSLGVIDD